MSEYTNEKQERGVGTSNGGKREQYSIIEGR